MRFKDFGGKVHSIDAKAAVLRGIDLDKLVDATHAYLVGLLNDGDPPPPLTTAQRKTLSDYMDKVRNTLHVEANA